MSVHDADYDQIRVLVGADEGEPLFILRGNDDLAVHTLAIYRMTASTIEDKSKVPSDEWFAELDKVMTTFANWRRNNPDRIKVPD